MVSVFQVMLQGDYDYKALYRFLAEEGAGVFHRLSPWGDSPNKFSFHWRDDASYEVYATGRVRVYIKTSGGPWDPEDFFFVNLLWAVAEFACGRDPAFQVEAVRPMKRVETWVYAAVARGDVPWAAELMERVKARLCRLVEKVEKERAARLWRDDLAREAGLRPWEAGMVMAHAGPPGVSPVVILGELPTGDRVFRTFEPEEFRRFTEERKTA